ncbi:hypothetical protein SNEBB_009916 [Seison nebaliae]|nr:hypothetical protein SNEBB_009916 [Seison nebaliae]
MATLRRVVNRMTVSVVSAASDNYMYIVRTPETVVVIDVTDGEKMVKELESQQVEPMACLTTHHHPDHCEGNGALFARFPKCVFYGGDERIEGVQKIMKPNEHLQLKDQTYLSLHTPCHTHGHMCYYIEEKRYGNQTPQRAVFTGDTLFMGGCGKFFEGDAKQMVSAMRILSQLPNDTEVFCGHEYTKTNLLFAIKSVGIDKEKMESTYKRICPLLKEKKPSIPSTIQLEKDINVFMKSATSPDFLKQINSNFSLQLLDEVELMHWLRQRKDTFTV